MASCAAAYERLIKHVPIPSRLVHHGASCCDIARAWYLAMDRSFRLRHGRTVPPSWLGEYHEWGPSGWPLSWCEAVNQESLDCGALACICTDVFLDRGDNAVGAQVVQRFDHEACLSWSERWQSDGQNTRWIDAPLVYHEVCAVTSDSGLRLWDPSESRWIDPSTDSVGHGRLISLKLAFPEGERHSFGNYIVEAGKWTKIDGPDAS